MRYRTPRHRAPQHRTQWHGAQRHRTPRHRTLQHRAPQHRAQWHGAWRHRTLQHRTPQHRTPWHRALGAQDTMAQDTGAQDIMAQGIAAQDTMAQDTGAQDTMAQNTVAQDTTDLLASTWPPPLCSSQHQPGPEQRGGFPPVPAVTTARLRAESCLAQGTPRHLHSRTLTGFVAAALRGPHDTQSSCEQGACPPAQPTPRGSWFKAAEEPPTLSHPFRQQPVWYIPR